MNRHSQLIQPFIYSNFSSILQNDKEIARPFHIYFYELAPKEKTPLNFSFIPSPYIEWIIAYDNNLFFNGNAQFLAVAHNTNHLSIDIPAFDHYFCIRFDDDVAFIDKNISQTFATLFGKTQTFYPTSSSPEEKLIEELQKSDSFLKRIRLFLNYLKTQKKQIIIPKVAALIQNALKYAPPNYNIADIAKEYDYTPRHISRIFKENYGYSPKDYVRFLRIQKALQNMLHNPMGTNRSFSQNLGYNDVTHFQREFKEFLGITPKEYLQKIC